METSGIPWSLVTGTENKLEPTGNCATAELASEAPDFFTPTPRMDMKTTNSPEPGKPMPSGLTEPDSGKPNSLPAPRAESSPASIC